MFKIFSKNKTINEERKSLFFVLEKFVNIALVKTERGDNESVKLILNELESIFRKFWKLKKDNPDKFDTLLWSQDFYDKYVIPLNESSSLSKDDQKNTKNSEELKQEAGLRLAFYADKQLKGLTQFLKSFEKIWESALKNENEEISRYAVYHLNWLLSELVKEKSNELFIEQFLRLLNSIFYIGIQNARRTGIINRSIYAAGIHWYTDIVFNRLGKNEKNFDLAYLELFDKYFFSNVRYIVSMNQKELFNSLVSTFVDGVHIPTYNQGEIWNYGHILLTSDFAKYNEIDGKHKIEQKVSELANSEKNIDSSEKLEDWLKKFNELKSIIEPNFNLKQKAEAEKNIEKIEEFVSTQYKYNNLLEIVFAIGAYCLFKKRYPLIKELWEYKQPSDSDASYVGHDIIPNSPEELIKFYFKKGSLERRFDFWEGHHGSESYYKKYFILLLARVLQNIKANGEGKYDKIESYNLPDLPVHRLSDMGYSIDELIVISKELKNEENILLEFGFNTKELDELLTKVESFLGKVKYEAQKQISTKHKIQKISEKKIKDFKKEILKSFYEMATIRDFFIRYLQSYENKISEEIKNKDTRYGINIIDDKASFFDEWHVHYVDWGENYGRELASGENSTILDEIALNCKEISEEEFENVLNGFDNIKDVILFASNVALWKFFENSKKFKPKWHRDTPQLDVNGFEGWFEHNNALIPIFETYCKNNDKQILILAKTKLGKLVQFSPLAKGDNSDSIEDIFYIDIKSFSEDPELTENFIKQSPEWLIKIGDEQKQREYLKERVRVHIFERFEFEKDENFVGYKLTLKSR